MNKLPVYEMVINPDPNSDVEVSYVAFVDKPAIERNFLMFMDDYGGPGSGPQGPGGGGGDSGGDNDIASVLKIPREQRTEAQVKTVLKRKTKAEVKDIVQNGKIWIKSNPDKVGTTEHRTVSREVNVGEKILKDFYGEDFTVLSLQKTYFALNEEKRIVSGPAMIADSLIYRKDEQGEYNVFFSADTIKQIALKFFKKDYHKNLNLFHDPTLSLDGVTIFESFVSDKERGIQPMKGFEDLPDGTWFISAKVENEEVWNRVKSGEVKGFSVEGIFSYVKKERIQNGLQLQSGHIVETSFMSEIKDLLLAVKEKLFGTPTVPVIPPVVPDPNTTLSTDYTLKDGTAVSIDKLEIGGVVMVGGAPAPAGEYELQDGTKCMVGEGGVITAVEPVEMAQPDIQSKIPDYTPKFTAYDQALAGYEAKFTEQAGQIQKQGEMLKSIFELVEKIAGTSAADPLEGKGNNFVSQKVKDREERLKELSNNLSNLKKAI